LNWHAKATAKCKTSIRTLQLIKKQYTAFRIYAIFPQALGADWIVAGAGGW